MNQDQIINMHNLLMIESYVNEMNELGDMAIQLQMRKNLRNSILLNEAYVGKTQNILNAEKYLAELLREMDSDPTKDYTNHPANKKLCEHLNKEFGFKELHITWTRGTKSMPAIFTIPGFDTPFRLKDKNPEKGYKNISKKHVCYIIASTPVRYYSDITPAEYMAVLLHEIGHNFDISWYQILALLINFIQTVINITNSIKTIQANKNDKINSNVANPMALQNIIGDIMSIGLSTNTARSLMVAYNKFTERISSVFAPFKKLVFNFLAVFDSIYMILAPLAVIARVVANPISVLINVPLAHVSNFMTRKSEQFADSFAAMYGYGPEISTALDKITTMASKEYFDDGKTKGLMMILSDLAKAEQEFIASITAGHGSTVDRTTNNIKYLEKELNSSDLTPTMKKEVQRKINQLKDINQALITDSKNGRYELTVYIRSIIYKAFKGDAALLAKLFPANYA